MTEKATVTKTKKPTYTLKNQPRQKDNRKKKNI